MADGKKSPQVKRAYLPVEAQDMAKIIQMLHGDRNLGLVLSKALLALASEKAMEAYKQTHALSYDEWVLEQLTTEETTEEIFDE